MFADVAPMLFGDSFEKNMKEHVEAMRCIRKTSNNKTEPFFRKGRCNELNLLTLFIYVTSF
ncbi:hypothetical protein AB9K17_24105, partial [Salmonella enterica subsp. enterica serovar Kentucky]|uniref:hypothetical protein n=1 Tax=Salmonella enterica TaxID=28901 RepID=UPI003F4BC24C